VPAARRIVGWQPPDHTDSALLERRRVAAPRTVDPAVLAGQRWLAAAAGPVLEDVLAVCDHGTVPRNGAVTVVATDDE
jgi:hypothetical protein